MNRWCIWSFSYTFLWQQFFDAMKQHGILTCPSGSLVYSSVDVFYCPIACYRNLTVLNAIIYMYSVKIEYWFSRRIISYSSSAVTFDNWFIHDFFPIWKLLSVWKRTVLILLFLFRQHHVADSYNLFISFESTETNAIY